MVFLEMGFSPVKRAPQTFILCSADMGMGVLLKKYVSQTSISCSEDMGIDLELFYLNSTLNFGIPTVLVFLLEVYYKVDRLLAGLTAQQKGTTA